MTEAMNDLIRAAARGGPEGVEGDAEPPDPGSYPGDADAGAGGERGPVQSNMNALLHEAAGR